MKFIQITLTLLTFFTLNTAFAQTEKVHTMKEVATYAHFPAPDCTNDINSCAKTKMITYLANNIEYPKAAKRQKQQGKVLISFVIDTDGSITSAKVLRSISELLDAEALRIINSMPNWSPAQLADGKKVKMSYILPIKFKL